MSMIDGDYVFYTIQHKRVKETIEWGNPDSEWAKCDDKWAFSWDFFRIEPWHGNGNDFRPVNKKRADQSHNVWAKTGYHGWWDKKYATQALKRLRAADEKGQHDTIDPGFHKKRMMAIRHKFRIVKITLSRKTEPVK